MNTENVVWSVSKLFCISQFNHNLFYTSHFGSANDVLTAPALSSPDPTPAKKRLPNLIGDFVKQAKGITKRDIS